MPLSYTGAGHNSPAQLDQHPAYDSMSEDIFEYWVPEANKYTTASCWCVVGLQKINWNLELSWKFGFYCVTSECRLYRSGQVNLEAEVTTKLFIGATRTESLRATKTGNNFDLKSTHRETECYDMRKLK